MTRATQDEITQMAREVMDAQPPTPLLEHYRAAILATLAKYAPDKLPADPDEELARKLANGWLTDGMPAPPDDKTATEQIALYVIKHMREKQA